MKSMHISCKLINRKTCLSINFLVCLPEYPSISMFVFVDLYDALTQLSSSKLFRKYMHIWRFCTPSNHYESFDLFQYHLRCSQPLENDDTHDYIHLLLTKAFREEIKFRQYFRR